MTARTRLLVPVFAAMAIGVALAPATSFAGHGVCKSDEEAEGKAYGIGPHARREAVHAAIVAWKHEVAAEHGWAYARWSTAREKDIRCKTRKGMTECEVEADPCLY